MPGNGNLLKDQVINRQPHAFVDNFDPSYYLGKKGLANKTRSTLFALAACHLLFQKNDPFLPDLSREDVGVCFASNAGSLSSIQNFVQTSLNQGFRATTPMQFPLNMVSAAAAHVAMWFDIQGFNATISSGISASLDVFNYCSVFLEKKRCNKIIAGAAEEISETCLALVNKIPCLRKDKIKFGEGAAALLIEHREKLSDFDNILAEVKGYGHAFCMQQNEDSALSAAVWAIRSALSNSGIDPSDIDIIYLNENGYRLTDEAEKKALNIIFPGRQRK